MQFKTRRSRHQAWALIVLAPAFLLFQNCGTGFGVNTGLVAVSSVDGPLDFNLAAERLSCSPNSRGMAEVESRRLSRSEIKGSLRSIFGTSFVEKLEIARAIENFSAETSQTYGRNFDPVLSSSYMDGVLATAEAVSETLIQDKSLLATHLAGCNPDANLNACVDELLSNFATKVLRRPIPAESKAEITSLLNGVSGIEKLQLGLMRLFVSPYFYQHIELGEQTSDGRVKLSSYEVASRLSYRLVGGGPDQELLTLAAKNELNTIERLNIQAKRLMGTAPARDRVREFFTQWLHLERTPDPDPKIQQLLGVAGAGLGSEAREEMLRFIDYIVFEKKGTFEDLLTSPIAFPYTDRLARLYGTNRSEAPVTLKDGRGGLILRAATLMNNSLPSNPIVRGVYLRSRLLCQPIPAPDPALVAARLNETAVLSHKEISNRVFVEKTTGVPQCMACHSMINPLGFSLEGFDGFGMPRAKELVYDDSARVVAEHNIDTSIPNLNISSGVVPADGATDLVQKIAASGRAKQCITQQYIEFTRERRPAAEDGCATNESVDIIEGQGSVQDVILSSTVNEDIFWKKAQ